MNWSELLYRLQFQDDRVLHEHVDSAVSHIYASVFHIDRHLTLKCQALMRKFNGKRILVYTLQITRPNHTMHINSATNSLISQVFRNPI